MRSLDTSTSFSGKVNRHCAIFGITISPTIWSDREPHVKKYLAIAILLAFAIPNARATSVVILASSHKILVAADSMVYGAVRRYAKSQKLA